MRQQRDERTIDGTTRRWLGLGGTRQLRGELGFGAAGDDAGGAAGEAGDFAGGAAAEVDMVGRKEERKREGKYLGKIRKNQGVGVRMTSLRRCQTKRE
jgi:hypothetical protein